MTKGCIPSLGLRFDVASHHHLRIPSLDDSEH
jgi:hypothetical protein